ncbi:MAG: pyridoxamine 5'-phosphate oxidase family protein [Lachnospiraceae bacterium]|nr:pyridoxamine 5'-phosphate oxidase family protein [Lachnospiraceae bacterium]
MRRSDREVTDFTEQVNIMKKCDVCRVAFHDEEYPYIMPLNFGIEIKNGQVILYFHGAIEGKKYDLMEKDNRVSFEMDCGHQLVTREEQGSCTMAYESVIGRGTMEDVPEEEKYDALVCLMRHYHKEDFAFQKEVMAQTRVFRLIVQDMTGKRRKVIN